MTTKQPAPRKTATNTTRKRKPRTPPAIADGQTSVPDTPLPETPEVEESYGLTDRQRIWIERYLTCWNATEAARLAGYKDPQQAGYENKTKQEIKAAIEARLEEYHLSANEVLARLSDHATSSMGDFISLVEATEDDIKRGIIDLSKAERAGKLHLIKRLSISTDSTTIELYSALDALQLLGRCYGLFSDNKPADRSPTVTVKGYGEMLTKVYGNRHRSKAIDAPGLEEMLDKKYGEK